MPYVQFLKIPNKEWPNTGAGSLSTTNGRIAFEYDAGTGFQLNNGDTMKYLNPDGQYSLPIGEVQNNQWVDLR